jgi:ribosomal protein L11 methyltransferase
VDVVLANIISSVLIELLPVIARSLAPQGAAILSGILLEERNTMLEILASSGWRVMLEDSEDIWWSVSVAPV